MHCQGSHCLWLCPKRKRYLGHTLQGSRLGECSPRRAMEMKAVNAGRIAGKEVRGVGEGLHCRGKVA